MCYSDCNTTHKYYYGTTCYSSCPDGTYLSYTNVHCIACSDLCNTCNTTASTCLSCHDRYYYNNTCITECPANYYGSSLFVCESCTSATNSICNEPLTFTT